MNQILSVGEMKKNKNSAPADIKKVAKFFSICILIFGLIFIGQGSYAIVRSMNTVDNSNKESGLPTVQIDRNGDNIIIKASHTIEIEKIIYNWNNEENKEILGNGSNYMEETISLPVGNNIFNIKVIDILGKEISYQKEYITDATKPQIAIETVAGNKIKIIAKDNTALSYITYRWDEDEEIKIEPNEETKAQITVEIDIPRGQHRLTIVAVNSNNVTETKAQEIKATTKPKISVSQDGKYLVIKATDEEAMKKIEYTLNGKPYIIDYSSVRVDTIEYRQEMTPGENRISIKAYNFDDIEETFEGICVYNP